LSQHCPICHTAASKRYYIRGYALLECQRCRALFVPSAALPQAPSTDQYDGSYLGRSHQAGDRLSGYFDYEAELPLHLRNFQQHLEIIRQEVSGTQLLDVGCASGHFLLAASRARYQVNGIDVSQTAIDALKTRFGFEAWVGDPAHLPLDRLYDAITLWETLEHMADPRPTLRRLRDRLRPEGRLFIGTGDNQSPLARALGSRWWYRTPPDHVIIYNRQALRHLLETCGYRLESWHRIGHHRVSARNVVMKLLRSFNVPGPVALRVAEATPAFPLCIPHGTTMVAVASSQLE